MTVNELLENKSKTMKYEFYYEDMEVVRLDQLSKLLKYPTIKLKEYSDSHRSAFKILITKNAANHAKNTRKVNTCMDCLRFEWCEDLSNELRKEFHKSRKNDEH